MIEWEITKKKHKYEAMDTWIYFTTFHHIKDLLNWMYSSYFFIENRQPLCHETVYSKAMFHYPYQLSSCGKFSYRPTFYTTKLLSAFVKFLDRQIQSYSCNWHWCRRRQWQKTSIETLQLPMYLSPVILRKW